MAKHASDDEIWDAFCAAIEEKDRDDILTQMAEAAHSDRHQTDSVRILNRTRHDVINVTVEGIVTYKDEEYSFHLEDGNWNGTQLRGWEETGTDWEEYVPEPLAIKPHRELIWKALAPGGNPKHLLTLWKIFEEREDVNKILRNYAYDRFFQPGGKIENHYKDQLDRMKISITVKTDADEVRKRLQEAADAQP